MPYFHATWAENMPSILEHGLGGARSIRANFEDVPEGVYLCVSPMIAMGFLIEAIQYRDDLHDLPPPEILDLMRVIVIDDSRIDTRKLCDDPIIDRKDLTKLYLGVIDVNGLPVLDHRTLTPEAEPSMGM